MQDILNKKQLEGILVSKWTDILDVPKTIQFAKESLIQHHNIPIGTFSIKVQISRFEFISSGFLIWLEIILAFSDKKVNASIECLLTNYGELSYLNSTID